MRKDGLEQDMIEVDCSELRTDEKLALASEISDGLEGRAIALVKGETIVLDQLTREEVGMGSVAPIIRGFLSRRKDSQYYSLEFEDDIAIVHSVDPVAASHRKSQNSLPPNLKQCPYCSFITEYEEEFVVHTRSHLFGV